MYHYQMTTPLSSSTSPVEFHDFVDSSNKNRPWNSNFITILCIVHLVWLNKLYVTIHLLCKIYVFLSKSSKLQTLSQDYLLISTSTGSISDWLNSVLFDTITFRPRFIFPGLLNPKTFRESFFSNHNETLHCISLHYIKLEPGFQLTPCDLTWMLSIKRL